MSLRDFSTAQERKEFLQKELDIDLKDIATFPFSENSVNHKNIENLIGATAVPLGVAGPILIKDSPKEYYIPLATTEGALVASISRGCKVASLNGGVEAILHNVGVTRSPVFKTQGIKHSLKIKTWISENFDKVANICESTSTHLKLLKIDASFSGKNLFLRFYFNTEDAMGMNMATIASEKAVQLIEQETKAQCISISGNYDVDKKASWLNFTQGRGKQVWAETIIEKQMVKDILKTTPEDIAEVVYRKCLVGSAMAGSIGFNAHFANIIAAIFLATGQDIAQVVEGSLGVTSAEVTENGDLYFSVYLPNLMVGTVGGGTSLPSQKAAFSILGITGSGETAKFAKIIGATVLAGELSLIASLAEGSLGSSHEELGRGRQV